MYTTHGTKWPFMCSYAVKTVLSHVDICLMLIAVISLLHFLCTIICVFPCYFTTPY